MQKTLSRRNLLRGKFHQGDGVLPPWAVAAPTFADLCDRCGKCIEACEEGILVAGDGGYPRVDFTIDGCTFCGECVSRCPTGALSRGDGDTRPWNHVAEITPACLALNGVVCRSCGEACEVAAIRFRLEPGGVARPLLDPRRCNGCGACIGICPIRSVQMISIAEAATA